MAGHSPAYRRSFRNVGSQALRLAPQSSAPHSRLRAHGLSWPSVCVTGVISLAALEGGLPPRQSRSYCMAAVHRNLPTAARREAPLAGSVQGSGLPHRRTAPGLLDTSQDEATAVHSPCSQPFIARPPSPSISPNEVPILVLSAASRRSGLTVSYVALAGSG